ncbi:MAG: peptidoglycan synthetase [Bacteroidales bacterium]|nr:peptidoglycan synthetase [Bacteroidales bacterium]MBR4690928.1 peptidoglycan synthetase [Bacteroidales bacterium]
MNRIHLLAIGGATLHNMAITLKNDGFVVTGSDDEIFDPSYSELKEHNLLPKELGWFEERVTRDIDIVIVGGKIQPDNPELVKAQQLGIPIYTYSEFIYEFSKDKQRVVIAGSYGKNMIVSIVMHVLSYYEYDYDYLLCSAVNDQESTIRLSKSSKLLIVEGDEHISSPIDERSKFEHYKPCVALLSGIAWEDVQAFPTLDAYVEQFKRYVGSLNENGRLIYCEDDELVREVISHTEANIKLIPYKTHPYELFNNHTFLKISGGRLPIYIFGEHNMKNIAGALKVCQQLKISEEKFYQALKFFKGPMKQLQLLGKNSSVNVYRDYVYSPLKMNATIKAIRELYPLRELVVCLEVASDGDVPENFWKQYDDSMRLADEKFVFLNVQGEETSKSSAAEKKVKAIFGTSKIKIFTRLEAIQRELTNIMWQNKNLLLLRADNAAKLDYNAIAKKVLNLNA